LRSEPEQAEATLRKSLTVARDQRAKSWELRAATTLARLLASRSHQAEAFAVLAPVYEWFTEGHDTRDLREAAQLLAELRCTRMRDNPEPFKKPEPTMEYHDV
jgi:predicted ATPase